jgi:thymidylate synthase (FAD)
MEQIMRVNIDSGFVAVVDKLGTDATIVNAARVSFGKRIETMDEKDKKLVKYLAAHDHTSPFRHAAVQLHVKAPEFVARQWYKHVVGSDYVFKDTAWNEISGRYVEYGEEFWVPEVLRKQSVDKKQGSSDVPVTDHTLALATLTTAHSEAYSAYKRLLGLGVCREQARSVLPLSIYTEWYWTASLQAIAHFVKLRSSDHAQKEIRDFASAIDSCMLQLFPVSWEALNASQS